MCLGQGYTPEKDGKDGITGEMAFQSLLRGV